MWFQFRPYVPVAQRRAQAAREVAKRRKKGETVTPVVIEGRTIAHTFWGKAWCDNLESYSDYENRLPRGRTYVRNGSVINLQIKPGKVIATVSGSELYDVEVSISPLPAKQWAGLKAKCAGKIGSLVELLQGKLSDGVIETVTAHDGGLFPKPSEIEMSCSCPDWAGMCKHIAAVLYGVGARLDHQPELLFLLRQVDHLELIEEAASRAGQTAGAEKKAGSGKKKLAQADVADVFGIELAEPEAPEEAPAAELAAKPKTRKSTKAKPAAEAKKPAAKAKKPAAKKAAPKAEASKAVTPKPAAKVTPAAKKPASKARGSTKAKKAKKAKEGEAGA